MMKKTFCTLFTVVVAVGCATSGVDFNYENRSNLKVGQSTKQDALGLLGNPSSVQTKAVNNDNYEIVQHVFASSAAGLGGETTSRVSTLEFKDGVLNTKAYVSSFDEDSTAFSIGNAEQIVVDKSTMDDAIRLLGEPSGSGECPSSINSDLCENEDASSVVSWTYVTKIEVPGDVPVSKVVILAVNSEGVVVAKETAS